MHDNEQQRELEEQVAMVSNVPEQHENVGHGAVLDASCENLVKCQDDPILSRFFKMWRFGVPRDYVESEMLGMDPPLDPALLDTPYAPSPYANDTRYENDESQGQDLEGDKESENHANCEPSPSTSTAPIPPPLSDDDNATPSGDTDLPHTKGLSIQSESAPPTDTSTHTISTVPIGINTPAYKLLPFAISIDEKVKVHILDGSIANVSLEGSIGVRQRDTSTDIPAMPLSMLLDGVQHFAQKGL